MSRFVLLFLLMTMMSLSVVAQLEDEEEEPLPPRRRAAAAKIGGGLGLTSSFLFLDVDPLNKFIREANAQELSTEALPLYGGGGYAYILVLPNFRVGGLGYTGTRKSRAVTSTSAVRRDVEMTVGSGGVTFEYVIPVMPRLDIAFGGYLGGGGIDLRITRDAGSPKVWGDLWDDLGSTQPVDEFSRSLEGTFFVYQPTVTIEYAVLRWLGVRVGASYQGMTGGNWELDQKYEVIDVPDDIRGQGFMINTGIFLGTYIF